MKSALIVVDVQNDFADPSGSLYAAGGENIAIKLAAAIHHKNPPGNADLVVATKDWHGGHPGDHFKIWPVHCVASTWGAEFHPAIDATAGVDQVFCKGQLASAYSGFEGTSDNHERQRDAHRDPTPNFECPGFSLGSADCDGAFGANGECPVRSASNFSVKKR